MKIVLELGNVSEIQSTIDAVQRAIDRKPLVIDFQYLIDVKSILLAIKKASEK